MSKIMVQGMSAKGGSAFGGSKIVIGNLKANILTLPERERFVGALKKSLAGKKMANIDMVVCPPFVHLENFVQKVKNQAVRIGAQNIFWEERGSFTGEVTAAMLKGLGVEFVILGHSERREYLDETDEMINWKLKLALKNGLVPILCVGETQGQRGEGKIKEVISRQISGALEGVLGNRLENIIVAYEPVWAVGTDVFPKSDEVMEARILIKKILVEKFGMKKAEKVRILYGGSVNPRVAKQLCVESGMDGVLVGRSSLVPSEFIKIAEIINNA